jgi:hypothetical protein
MRRALCVGLAVALGWCGSAVAQRRPGVPGGPSSTPQLVSTFHRAVSSQLVVKGTVSMGNETVEVEMYPGQPVKTTFSVATIKVAETLIGDKSGDTVTILIPPADPAQIPFEGPGRPAQYFRPAISQVQVIDGQEGVFFLSRHQTSAAHYQLSAGCPPLNPLDTNYKDNLATVTKVGAAIADPMKALKAEKASDRYDAAAVLVSWYRRVFSAGNVSKNEVAVPAEETKLILKAIAEYDWAEYDVPVQPGDPPRDYTKSPTNLLALLGIYPGQHGFPQVRVNPGQQYHAAYQEQYKTWLDGAGAKFELKRFKPANK